MLFNEVDLLELRFRELWEVVDRFAVVEATFSHGGARKPLFFEDHRARFAPYLEKVVYRAIREPPIVSARTARDRAVLERFQRDAIGAALAPLALRSRAIVLVSDVDEIPRPGALASLDVRLAASRYAVFVQRPYERYVNLVRPAGTGPIEWLGTVATRFGTLRRKGAHHVRRGGNRAGVLRGRDDPRWSYVEDGGWHLSWMGGAEAAWTKARNVLEVLERALGFKDLGPPAPIRVFPTATSRDECRALQAHFLAHAEPASFTPLDFDRFEIEQDVPAALRRDKDRYRRWFFFTSGL
jgi:beta-1,4-mannosyl-glycoprotein beta-1,4-N-acetylglucosaminyltransferase